MTDRAAVLRTQLEAFDPADTREAEFRDRMVALTQVSGDPFSRDHFDPGHFTASAFILSPSGGEILLILHSKLGLWLQPGGHIDPEDGDVFDAALREVREETGLTELVWMGESPELFDVDIHTIPARPGKEPAHQHFDVRVVLQATDRRFTAGSDAQDARWVPLSEVSLGLSDESVMRAVRKLSA